MAGQRGLAQVPQQREVHEEQGWGATALEHQWVAAAVVEIGRGTHTQRAERAMRTGRYILATSTRIEVLEVYCRRCRIPFSPRVARLECETAVDRDSGRSRTGPRSAARAPRASTPAMESVRG